MCSRGHVVEVFGSRIAGGKNAPAKAIAIGAFWTFLAWVGYVFSEGCEEVF